MDRIYPELRRMARSRLRREKHEDVLQPTALVHEAYLRLIAQEQHNWRNRAHFFAAAARLMHRILIDEARYRHASKRSCQLVPLDQTVTAADAAHPLDLLVLEQALEELRKLSARQHSVVEMRYFGGLTIEETAEALGLEQRTVDRDWAVARAWLRRRLLA
jgi:RNA polymerase sigma factor (TIGR02999 family)